MTPWGLNKSQVESFASVTDALLLVRETIVSFIWEQQHSR